MHIESPETLRVWLTASLRPLCDADPAALAKYVLALLKKEKPDGELKQGMLDQLDVFLQEETVPFVEKLFIAIANKSYLSSEFSEPLNFTNSAKADSTINSKVFDSTLQSTTLVSNTMSSSKTISSSDDEDNHEHPAEPKDYLDIDTSDNLSTISSVTDNEVTDTTSIISTSSSCHSSAERRPSRPIKDDKGRRSRSPRKNRSRSRDRGRRSYSPKDMRHPRHRVGFKKSPPFNRRYDRETYDRRYSPNFRNRSSSPHATNRGRSPGRYRRAPPYDGGAGSKKGRISPRDRSRSRSPLMSQMTRSSDPSNETAKINPITLLSNPNSLIAATSKTIPNESGNELFQNPPCNDYEVGIRCKDFEERGLCYRGGLCPYDHGTNPVVLSDGNASENLKRSLICDPAVSAIPFRNQEMETEVMDQGMGWGNLGSFPPGGPRSRGMMIRHSMFPMSGPPRELINIPVHGPPTGPHGMDMDMGYQPMHHMGLMYPGQVGMHQMRGRGRGVRGIFDHGRLGGKTKIYNNCSLEVKKIPKALNTISDLNSHFVQFGKIVNIQINFENDPEAALITFSTSNEAHAAYKSTEAVLNNRFIRVFWHNKEKENEEGDAESDSKIPRISAKDRLGSQASHPEGFEMMDDEEKVLASGNNITKTFYNPNALAHKKEISQEKVQAVEAIKKSQEELAAKEQLKRAQEERKKETIKLVNDLRKKKQCMLVEQIEQQKKLINKLEMSKSMKPEEKEELMKLIKSLQESIENIKKDMDQSNNISQLLKSQQPSKPNLENVRDALDADLEMYATEAENNETNHLKQKVSELRAQARGTGFVRGGRGGFSGSIRGYSARGRGSSMSGMSRTVDRRTTTIIVTGFDVSVLPELMSHFAQFGLVPSHKIDYDEPSLTMTYDNRKSAETALLKGKVFKDTSLNIKWVPLTQVSSEKINEAVPISEKDGISPVIKIDETKIVKDEEVEENTALLNEEIEKSEKGGKLMDQSEIACVR